MNTRNQVLEADNVMLRCKIEKLEQVDGGERPSRKRRRLEMEMTS